MATPLVLAAHGTRSPTGSATLSAIADAVRSARTNVPVELCFLDVARPSLRETLDGLDKAGGVVVPLLLSAGYHVRADIPLVVADRPGVVIARHLGPDPAIVAAVADRLREAGATGAGPTLLAAVDSSRADARAEVAAAATQLSRSLDREVTVLPLREPLDVPDRAELAPYLLAEGTFLDLLQRSPAAVVAAPVGAHPALVELVWSRYDEAVY